VFFLLKTNPGCLSPPITSLQVDRSELAAAFKLFDETAIDPTFCDRMMSDLLPDDQGTLDFDEFSNFLVQFLQHQFLHKLEPFISNQSLFITLGGRDLSAVIEEERKKEQVLELSNAQLEHDLHQARIALARAMKKGESSPLEFNDGVDSVEDGDELDEALGKDGVLVFFTNLGLAEFGPILVEMGVDSIRDLQDPELVADEELGEVSEIAYLAILCILFLIYFTPHRPSYLTPPFSFLTEFMLRVGRHG
jgi:hypothetical protein